MCRTLVVIDMQATFDASNNPKLINRINRLVKQWTNLGWPILIVEYEGFDQTQPKIRKMLDGYTNWTEVFKNTDGGARKILEACDANGFPDKFVVCGVNTSACVRDTVTGLTETYGCDTIVVRKACAGSYRGKHAAIRRMAEAGARVVNGYRIAA